VKYDADALEFQHAREIKQRQKVKRKSSLKTYKVSRFVVLACLFAISLIVIMQKNWTERLE